LCKAFRHSVQIQDTEKIREAHEGFALKTKYIGLRLGIAFGALIALLAGIGQLGLRRMHEIDGSFSDIIGRQSSKLQLAQRALELSNRNSRITMEIFLVHDRALIDTLLTARSENTKEISELLAEIERRCESAREKQLLSAVEKAREPYVGSYLRALHLVVNEGKYDAATAIMVKETLPALLKYHSAWNEFVEFQKDQVNVAVRQTRVDYSKTRRLVSFLVVLAVTIAFVIAVFTVWQAQKTHRESEVQYRLLFDSNPLPMWVFERKTLKFLAVNEAASRQYGFSSQEFLTMTIADIRPEEDLPALSEATAKTIRGLQEATIWRHRKRNGAIIDVEIISHDLTFHGIEAELIAARDVTERKLAEEAILFKTALLEAQAETTIDGILVVDEFDHIILANKQFGFHLEMPFELLSTRDDRIVLKHMTDKVEAPDAFIERVKYLNSHQDEKSRDELRLKNGKIFDRYSAPLVDSNLHYRGRIWYFRDITHRKVAEERVQFLAYYDALTGLPNRTLLLDRLAKALAAARRQNNKLALLYLDLDRFKDINDSLGHSVGDLLLQGIAERLKTWGREQDTVARLGGDEFLIMLTSVKDISDAAVAAERLMDAMTAEFVVQGHSLSIGCSIGISIFPEHGTDTETLIKNADAAMYRAKESGRNNFRFFTEDMNDQAAERLALEHSLRLALPQNELFLMYQPQMDMATGKIVGLEALLRWKHPEFGLVPPDRFIRIAENSGLILPIGEWVLRTACSQARKWQEEGLPVVTVAVNVSAIQFRQEGFCELIRRVLHETGLAPQYLELELTESLLLANPDVMLSVAHKLKAMGLTLAIDDFGTGYSSFGYLRKFQVSKLKIDRSFVCDVAVNSDAAAITTAIITMAKSLHLKVIAEGVENEAQMSFLRAHQCDEIQGYYFSKPLAVDKVADKLRSNVAEPRARAQASGAQS
jgi:diguanylate cyclase (GGDEF)-like protein/PAS domain S-box-containing protein